MQLVVINKTPYTDQVTLTIDGECNHAGAEEQDLEFAKDRWDNDCHRYVPDDSEIVTTLVCDKCEAWVDDDGYWRQD